MPNVRCEQARAGAAAGRQLAVSFHERCVENSRGGSAARRAAGLVQGAEALSRRREGRRRTGLEAARRIAQGHDLDQLARAYLQSRPLRERVMHLRLCPGRGAARSAAISAFARVFDAPRRCTADPGPRLLPLFVKATGVPGLHCGTSRRSAPGTRVAASWREA